MPITIQGTILPLTAGDALGLWQATIANRRAADHLVTVRCVSRREIMALNQRYRNVAEPTNVLTFSYGAEHDIALCRSVIAAEAQARAVEPRDYWALVLVHAFLHATGLDHERAARQAEATLAAERAILVVCHFEPLTWR